MKSLKIAGVVVLSLIALLLIIAATQPTSFNYESSIDIAAPKEVIFSKVSNLKAWEEWGPWAQMDTTMQVSYGDKTEGVGATYAWKGKETGEGKMTVTESTAPTDLKLDLEFSGQGGNSSYFKLQDGEGGKTKTIWGMDMHIPFPMNAMMAFMGGKMKNDMNEMYDMGLANLKAVSEKESAPAPNKYTVRETTLEPRSYAGIRSTVNFPDIPMFLGKSYQVVGMALGAQKLQPAGPPVGLYWTYDEAAGKTDMAAAMAFKANGAVPKFDKKITLTQLGGSALTVDYYGAYAKTGDAHMAIDAYMKEKGFTNKTPVIEEYITDPMSERDTAKWLTKIIYFVEATK